MVQLSHPYITTGKTIALTIWIFVGIYLLNVIFLKSIEYFINCYVQHNTLHYNKIIQKMRHNLYPEEVCSLDR